MKQILLFTIICAPLFIFGQKNSLQHNIYNITDGKKATVAVSVLGIDFPFEFNNENANKKLPMLSIFKFHIAFQSAAMFSKNRR